MSNTGYAIPTILREYFADSGLPTGNIKFNNPSDPDYVAPVLNTTICPTSTPIPTPLISCGQGVVNGIYGSVMTHEAPRSGTYVLFYNAQTMSNSWRVYYLNGASQIDILTTDSLVGSGTISFDYTEPQWLIGGNRLYIEVIGGVTDNSWSYQLTCPSIVAPTITPSPTDIPTIYPQQVCYQIDATILTGVSGTFEILDGIITNNAPTYYRIIGADIVVSYLTKQTGNTWLFQNYIYATGETISFDTTLGTGAYNGLLGLTANSGVVTEGACTSLPLNICYQSTLNVAYQGTFVQNLSVVTNDLPVYERVISPTLTVRIEKTLVNNWNVVLYDSVAVTSTIIDSTLGGTEHSGLLGLTNDNGTVTESVCSPETILYNNGTNYYELAKIGNQYEFHNTGYDLIISDNAGVWEVTENTILIDTASQLLGLTNQNKLLIDVPLTSLKTWLLTGTQTLTTNSPTLVGDFTISTRIRAVVPTDIATFLSSPDDSFKLTLETVSGTPTKICVWLNGVRYNTPAAYTDLDDGTVRNVVVQRAANVLSIWWAGIPVFSGTCDTTDIPANLLLKNTQVCQGLKIENQAMFTTNVTITDITRPVFDTKSPETVFLTTAVETNTSTVFTVIGTAQVNNVTDFTTLYQFAQ